MKRNPYLLLFLLFCGTNSMEVAAQNCSSATPLFYVDLTGQPNGVWQSPPILRDGDCCGTGVNCIEFIVTLDSMANGILFNIVVGAVPGGALYYQLNCGPPTSIGTPICLDGPGPHDITFCKPGNNLNVYQIASIPIPEVTGTEWVSEACTGNMSILGLEPATITWSSVPNNPTYNSFLSCASPCNSVSINPTGILPAFIDYQVCGYPLGGCYTTPFCDTMRVNFVNTLDVAITPQNPVICFGAPPATVTANITGGNAPYNYVWNTGATTQSIVVGAGTYYVSITDSMNCSVVTDSVVVSAMASTIVASAGPDQLLCMNKAAAPLNGSVVAATGGIWSGGSGTFTPNNTTLNATYTPTPTEINNGSVQLSLITTGNNTCPGDTDQVVITLSPNPAPQPQGPTTVCEFSQASYTTPFVSGNTYNWTVSGGSVVTILNNSITVLWGTNGNGSITATATNSLQCDSSVTLNIQIAPQPVPVINGPLIVCTTTQTSYNVVSPQPGNTYAWTVMGGTISGPATGSSVNVLWNASGTATISVTETNNLGCDSTVSVSATALTLPSPQLAGPDTICEMQTVTYSTSMVTGNTYNWNVTGGTILSNNNNSITVQWSVSGNGLVTLTESNTSSCDSTISMGILIAPQPFPVINGPLTTCTTTTTSYGVVQPVPGNTYSWIVNGGIISGPSTGSSINILWSNTGTASISVTEANNLGCDSTITVNATVLSMPAPVIAGPDTVCAGQTITYSTSLVVGNSYSWNVSGGTVVTTNNNSITILWPLFGNGSVSVTESNTSVCDSTVSTTIVIAPQPVPVINGPLTTCTTTISQYSLQASSPGNTYAWIVNGGTITGSSTGTSISVLWANSGTATVSVTEMNSLGCDSSVTVSASVLTMPAPVIFGPDTVCEGETITYTTPLVSGNSYNWNVTGGIVTATNLNSITVTWPSNGSGSISLTETNTSACDSSVSTSIIIAPQPAPVINGAFTTCTTTSTIYNVTLPVPGNTYSWTVTGGTINGSPNGTSIEVEWTTAGTATITLLESNSLGCDSTVSVTASVLTIPTPSISGPDTVCALHSFVYSTPLVAGNTYNWNVNGGIIIATNNNSITVEWPANGSGSVSLTESNSAACVTSVTTTIFIAPQPVPEITGTLTSCSATYSQFSIANATSGNSYSWSATGATIIGPSNGTTVTVFWNNAGTAVISFTESNNLGCDSTVSASINVLQRPEPEISGPPVVCEEVQATYTVNTYIPSHSYYWSVINGTIIGLNVGNSIDVLWNNAGTGSVTLRQVSTNGCDSTTVENVIINPLPAPAISGPITPCENEPAVYTTSLVPGNNYQWTTTGGIINGNPTASQITISWASGPMANVYLTETTAEGCQRFTQLPVEIRSKPEPGIQGSTVGCIGSIQNTYFTIPEPGINYQWSTSGGFITSGNGTSNITVQWQTAGNQTITLTAVNALTGCDSTVTFNVQTGALPTPVIQGPALSGCIPLVANFSGNVLNPAFSYAWDFGDGTTASGPNPSHQYNQPGTYDIQLIVMNNTGCIDTVMAQVNAFPVPQAAFDLWHGTEVYYANLSTMTLTNLSTGGNNYFWTFDDGNNSQEFEPEHQYVLPGNYTIALVVTNQYGCRDIASANLEVKVPENLYIPNAFTPNGDSKNDHFSVVAYNINDFRINIFNRWGRIIYTSTDPDFKWDGTHNGRAAINDVYVYAVVATGIYGTAFNLTGTITVVK